MDINKILVVQITIVDFMKMNWQIQFNSKINQLFINANETSVHECGRWDSNPRTPKGQDPQFIRS